jgi:hypothetical protein
MSLIPSRFRNSQGFSRQPNNHVSVNWLLLVGLFDRPCNSLFTAVEGNPLFTDVVAHHGKRKVISLSACLVCAFLMSWNSIDLQGR